MGLKTRAAAPLVLFLMFAFGFACGGLYASGIVEADNIDHVNAPSLDNTELVTRIENLERDVFRLTFTVTDISGDVTTLQNACSIGD